MTSGVVCVSPEVFLLAPLRGVEAVSTISGMSHLLQRALGAAVPGPHRAGCTVFLLTGVSGVRPPPGSSPVDRHVRGEAFSGLLSGFYYPLRLIYSSCSIPGPSPLSLPMSFLKGIARVFPFTRNHLKFKYTMPFDFRKCKCFKIRCVFSFSFHPWVSQNCS